MFYTNGRPETANRFTVDGINANLALTASESVAPVKFGAKFPQTAAGGLNTFISREGVEQFDVEAWMYNSNRAVTSGKQIFASSKRGSNEFHGTLFENFGNSTLNANDWFANNRGLRKPVAQSNSFGGALGGPIIRNALSFFTTYEGLRLRLGSFAITDVPSLASRQNASSNIKPLLNAFPLPNGATRNDGFAEFASTFTTPASVDNASLRLDYHGYKFRPFARYNYSNSYATTRGNDGFSLNILKRSDNKFQTITGGAVYTANHFTSETFANYSRVSLGQSYSADNFGGANVASSLQTPFANGFDFSKYDLYGRNAAIALSSEINGVLEQLNFSTNFVYFLDTHLLHFGADYRRLSFTTGAQPTERSVLFNGINGALSETATRVNFITRLNNQETHINEISAFAEDKWRVRRRLTLNYGVRWQTNIPISSTETPLALVNTNLPFNFATDEARLWKSSYNNFAPRVAVAYALDDSEKSTVRAGVGWFYDNANIDAPEIFGQGFPFANGAVAFNQPYDLLNQNQMPNKTFIGYDPNLKLPYVRQWSVSFMRELSNSMTLTATYEGSQGRRLLVSKTFLNQDPQFPFARLTTNEGESDYNAFKLRFQRILFRGFALLLNYSLTKSTDNISPDTLSKAVVSTPAQDKGFSDFDTRHSFNGYVSYTTAYEFENKILSHLLSRWTFATFLNLRSAMPLNIVYGRVNNLGISYLRPNAIQGAELFLNDRINPSAFAIPINAQQGSLQRNSLRSVPFYQFDLGASKEFEIKQQTKLAFRLGITNVFNHTNFAAPSFFDLSLGTFFPNGVFLPNSTFGQTSSLATTATEREIGTRIFSSFQPNASRSLQLSVKFSF